MRCTNALGESSFHMIRASNEILLQGIKNYDAWSQGPGNCDPEDADNVDEDIKIGFKDVEIN